MNYQGITQASVIDGLGVRVVLWLSGCNHRCKGCHNPETWDWREGKLFTEDTLKELIGYLKPDYIKGLTLSGGDPLYEKNLYGVAAIIAEVRKQLPNKDIWLYSGYTWEDLHLSDENSSFALRRSIAETVDYFVDGRFVLAERDITLPFRGSRNQRIIDVQKTLQSKGVKLLNV